MPPLGGSGGGGFFAVPDGVPRPKHTGLSRLFSSLPLPVQTPLKSEAVLGLQNESGDAVMRKHPLPILADWRGWEGDLQALAASGRTHPGKPGIRRLIEAIPTGSCHDSTQQSPPVPRVLPALLTSVAMLCRRGGSTLIVRPGDRSWDYSTAGWG